MHDFLLVCRAEPMRDLDRPLDGFTDRERAASKSRSQRLAFQQFSDGVRDAIGRSEIEDGDDGRMRESCDGFGFTFKPGKGDAVVRQLRGKDFDGNSSFEPSVSGAVDLTHTAGPEWTDNLVRPRRAPACRAMCVADYTRLVR